MFYAHKSTHSIQPLPEILREFALKERFIYMLYDAAALPEDAYQNTSQQLKQLGSSVSLFEHTQDKHLKDAAPWLVLVSDVEMFCASRVVQQLQQSHEKELPCMTWLISDLDVINLQKHLTPFLDVRLRNGKEAIMRFYDPRVLPTFFKLLSDEQVDKLMSHIQLWTYHDVKQNQYIAYQGVQQDGIK